MLKNATSIVQGLVLGVFSLEMMGALLVGWNWWEHRVGVQISRIDFIAASSVVAALVFAPLLSVLAFFLERRSSSRTVWVAWLGIAALTVRLALLTSLKAVSGIPWTLEILSGKRTDCVVGIGATCIWLGLIYLHRRRADLASEKYTP